MKKIISILLIVIVTFSITTSTAIASPTSSSYSQEEVHGRSVSGFNQVSGSSGDLYVTVTGYSLIGHATIKFLYNNSTCYAQIICPNGSKTEYAECTPGEHDNNVITFFNATSGTYRVNFFTSDGLPALVQCWIY